MSISPFHIPSLRIAQSRPSPPQSDNKPSTQPSKSIGRLAEAEAIFNARLTSSNTSSTSFPFPKCPSFRPHHHRRRPTILTAIISPSHHIVVSIVSAAPSNHPLHSSSSSFAPSTCPFTQKGEFLCLHLLAPVAHNFLFSHHPSP